ncbi:MAG: DUF5011 domain-containing protein [Bacteroidales bacterium]|nr:DUF5011 domain-containing protein [Bacteroidales bacterium]
MKRQYFIFIVLLSFIFATGLSSCNKDEGLDDSYPPFILLKGTNPTWSQLGEPYTDSGAEAFDITANQDTINISGRLTQTDNININETGSYKVFYDVSDAAGNKAEQVVRSVYVNRFK